MPKRRSLKGVELAREIAATAPMSESMNGEAAPGEAARFEEASRAHVRLFARTRFHPAGTGEMGVDPMAVVDPRLRVHGLAGLRVADASITPNIIGGIPTRPRS